jgi:hypothetical protein
MKKYFIDLTYRLEVEVPENLSDDSVHFKVQNAINNLDVDVKSNDKVMQVKDHWVESAKIYKNHKII